LHILVLTQHLSFMFLLYLL